MSGDDRSKAGQKAIAQSDKRLVDAVRADPGHLAHLDLIERVKDAKRVLQEAHKQRFLKPEQHVDVDLADRFLAELASAVRHAPNDRTRAILEACHHLTRRLKKARPVILKTPKVVRHRRRVHRKLAASTGLPEDLVKRLLESPRTGAKTLARQVVGEEFDITDEQVRKLQAKYRNTFKFTTPFFLVQHKPKGKPKAP